MSCQRDLLSDCIGMLVFVKNWKGRSNLVSSLLGNISNLVELSIARHTTNYKHYWHVGNQAMDRKL